LVGYDPWIHVRRGKETDRTAKHEPIVTHAIMHQKLNMDRLRAVRSNYSHWEVRG